MDEKNVVEEKEFVSFEDVVLSDDEKRVIAENLGWKIEDDTKIDEERLKDCIMYKAYKETRLYNYNWFDKSKEYRWFDDSKKYIWFFSDDCVYVEEDEEEGIEYRSLDDMLAIIITELLKKYKYEDVFLRDYDYINEVRFLQVYVLKKANNKNVWDWDSLNEDERKEILTHMECRYLQEDYDDEEEVTEEDLKEEYYALLDYYSHFRTDVINYFSFDENKKYIWYGGRYITVKEDEKLGKRYDSVDDLLTFIAFERLRRFGAGSFNLTVEIE